MILPSWHNHHFATQIIGRMHILHPFSILFSISLVLITYRLPAQITEEVREMSMGQQPAMVITLPGTSEEVVENVWKSYVKSFGAKSKYERKEKEYWASDVDILLSGDGQSAPVALCAVTESVPEGAVRFILWLDRGQGSFISSIDKGAWQEAQKFLFGFALEVARTEVALDLERQEAELRRLESTLKKLRSDRDHYDREIENARQRIARAEENIRENQKEQLSVRQLIDGKISTIEQVKARLKELSQ